MHDINRSTAMNAVRAATKINLVKCIFDEMLGHFLAILLGFCHDFFYFLLEDKSTRPIGVVGL